MFTCPNKDLHSVYLDGELSDEYKAKYEKRHHAKAKGMKGIIKYNTYKNEYTEYDSIESCVRAEKIPRQKLEILLRTGEEWNGYRFVEA